MDQSYHQTMKSPVDITLIELASFEQHKKHKNTEVFITSLYKIDWIIEEKQLKEQQVEEMDEQELIQQQLPQQYKEYSDVFSKAASDELCHSSARAVDENNNRYYSHIQSR